MLTTVLYCSPLFLEEFVNLLQELMSINLCQDKRSNAVAAISIWVPVLSIVVFQAIGSANQGKKLVGKAFSSNQINQWQKNGSFKYFIRI